MSKNESLILQIIGESHRPISASELLAKLPVNKTTVYRNIDKLLLQNKIKEVNILPHVTLYESADLPHHHHLMCRDCGEVHEIETHELEGSMQRLEKKMMRIGFAIEQHNLEFYGLCANCHE
jgi:Fe2+ or Zn2+ uptake regulation protein